MMRSEVGASLMETAIALALLGIIGVSLLGALATTSSGRSIANEQASARILAESQMEYVKKKIYALSYDAAPIPNEYAGYSVLIDVDPLQDGNVEKITVIVKHHNKTVTTLESYKVRR